MSLLIGQPHQQVCMKCRWKNEMIFTSDCIVGAYEKCPKCGGNLTFIPLSFWQKLFRF